VIEGVTHDDQRRSCRATMRHTLIMMLLCVYTNPLGLSEGLDSEKKAVWE